MNLAAIPPFNDFDTAQRESAVLQSEARMQVVSEATDDFLKADDLRRQPSGASETAKVNPQAERGGVHQFGVPPRGNDSFAWVQHHIFHIAWESEVWIAEDPDHMIHFNGERFLGPYPDAMPTNP